MVKKENWKTCEQSGFCKRNRAYADNVAKQGSSWTSPYQLVPKTLKIRKGYATATILKSIGEGKEPVELPLTIRFQAGSVARVTIDEARRIKGDIELRHDSQARKERYNEVSNWALIGEPKLDPSAKMDTSESETIIKYGPQNAYTAVIKHNPFSIEFQRDGKTHVKLNSQGLMNMEHWRPKVEREKRDQPEQKEGEPKEGEETKQPEPEPEPKPEPETGEDESTWWEESFGGNTDSKPRGPESVGMDVVFPGYGHVYGIPGHASTLSLKETRLDLQLLS